MPPVLLEDTRHAAHARQWEPLIQQPPTLASEDIRSPIPAPTPGTGEEIRLLVPDAAPFPAVIGQTITDRSGLGGDLAETTLFMLAHEEDDDPAEDPGAKWKTCS